MSDLFYERLDFYRMLEAGMKDLNEIAEALGVNRGTLWRWKKACDPGRGPFNNMAGRQSGNGFRPEQRNSREEILAAIRHAALDGNVQAAKLLLAEYQDSLPEDKEILTVERATELLRDWFKENSLPV
jgi:hypothetical protein